MCRRIGRRPGQALQRLDGGHQLHPVVRGGGALAAADLLGVRPVPEQCAPAARARVAAARAVSVDLDRPCLVVLLPGHQASAASRSASGSSSRGVARSGRPTTARSAPASRYCGGRLGGRVEISRRVGVQPDVHRAGDLRRIPAKIGAVPEQGLLQVQPVGRILRDGVPLLCPPRRRAQGPLLAPAADHHRRMGTLDRFRLAARVGEPEIASVERRGGIAQQPDDGLDALVEPVEPLRAWAAASIP